MTHNTFAALINKKAIYNNSGLKIPVCILNVRAAFGRIDYKIQPISFDFALTKEEEEKNTKWVDSNSVRLLGTV